MNRNANWVPILFLFWSEKISTRKLDQKRSGIVLMTTTTRRVRHSRRIDDGNTSGHPVLRSTSPVSKGVLKSKGGRKLSIHFCVGEETVETVFRTITSVNQLSIYGGASDLCEECKDRHVWMAIYVMVGQSDPLFVPTSSLMKTPTPLTDDLAQEDLLQKYQERVERLIKFCIHVYSWQLLTPDSTSWQKTLKNSRNLPNQWLVGLSFCQEMKNHLTRKVGFKGTPKFGPYWKSQPVTYKVNMKTTVSRGSEFLIVWIGWSRTWATIRGTTTMST